MKKCPLLDIGKTIGMPTTDTKSLTISMIPRRELTMLITLGIPTLDGALKSQVAKLPHLLILILTFRVLIITMMILDLKVITGTE